MKSVTFEIDEETGRLTATIEGIEGAACEAIARVIRESAGEPTIDLKTREFHVRPTVRQVAGR